MKILFQGDSITNAFRKPEEINPAYQLGNGYVFLIASSLARKYPKHNIEFINRGVSGNTVIDLLKRWDRDCLDIKADVISLLAGVNYVFQAIQQNEGCDIGSFIQTYLSLLDSAEKCNPRVTLIIMEPFLLEVSEVTSHWKTLLQPAQQAIAKVAAERKLLFIPLQRIFDEACNFAPAAYWIYDGIHPTHAGFNLIAEAWLAAATPLLGLAENPQ